MLAHESWLWHTQEGKTVTLGATGLCSMLQSYIEDGEHAPVAWMPKLRNSTRIAIEASLCRDERAAC